MSLSRYFEICQGEVPIILSCPHGGYKKPKSIPDKKEGYKNPDINTYFIAKQIVNGLRAGGMHIYYILNKIHRVKVDLNRPSISESAYNHQSIEAQNIHQIFHDQLDKFAQDCITKFDRALIIDFHGFTRPYLGYPDIILGHVFGKSLDIKQDASKHNCERYWGCSQLHSTLSERFTIDDGLAISDFNRAYSGGYITHKFYNSEKINAIQIEVAKYIRLDYHLTIELIRALVSAIKDAIL